MTDIIEQPVNSLQIVESSPFEHYLKQYGLPYKNVIASTTDKNRVSNNLPDLLNSIPQSHRQNALYMSKFISSVAIGRFDSALNDLWNEVVETLRNKANHFGLDEFFDSAVSGNKREFFSTMEDFVLLKDIVLVQTCSKLEIISAIIPSFIFILTCCLVFDLKNSKIFSFIFITETEELKIGFIFFHHLHILNNFYLSLY